MAEQFQVDDVEMKMSVLTAFSKRAKLPADHKSLGEQAVGLVDGAIAHDNIDLAVKLCELALPEARASRDADLLREVNARSEQCKVLAKAYREMKEAAAVLDKKPDDPLANLTVGKYYCFQKGDWEKGLPMLALGQDEALKAVAAQEIAGVTKADDQVKVGDAWWGLAEKEQGKVQATLRGRANYWYQQALPELSGLAKAKLEKRIKEYETASEGSEGPCRRRKRAAKYLPGLVAQYYNDATFVAARPRPAWMPISTSIGATNSPDPLDQCPELQRPLVRLHQGAQDGPLHYPRPRPLRLPGDDRQYPRHRESSDGPPAPPISRPKSPSRPATTSWSRSSCMAYGLANIHLGWQPPGEPRPGPPSQRQNLFHDQRQEQAAGISGR